MHPASLVAAPDAATQNNQSTETSSDQAKQEKTEGLSNAEQILKIEANIEADGKRIQELKKELEIKQKTFTRISDGLKNLGKQKAEKEQQLAEQADQKGPTAQDLKQDIESLSREYELFNTQANLNLKAQKTLQEQIKGLEEKRLNDKNLLDGLKGKITVEDTGQTEKVQTIPGRPAEDITPAIKTPLPIPSTPAETAPEKEEEVEALATPEQIEAQKEEQEKRAEAKQAEQIVVDYVERKKALENQIRREQQLLDNEIQSRSNIENYLSTLDGKLDKARQEGKQEDIKQLQKDIPDIRKELRRVQNDIVARSVLLNQLHQQLTEVQAGQLQAVETAEEKRQAAETARQKNVWLQSPLHPHNIAQWVMTRGPRVLLVIALMILLLFISRVSVKRVARAVSRKGRGSIEGRVNRAETIALSMDAVLRLLIYVGGTFLVLEEAGVDIKTILGGAAIIGLAFAFGAQNLMRDYFSGIMILMEDQYELGDVVTVGNVTGVVERVNMRATVLRDIEGRVHFIPNGEIKQVTNRTYEWAQAVFDINVSYKENVDEVMTLLMELAKQLQEDPDYRDYILSDPVMLGVNEFGNAAVTIKFMIKTQADKMWPIRREMLRRIKNKFDEVGIQIPIQQREVFQVTSD
ncbi:mechanosensitive ion channel domain-containing protein [Kaarinaea lacus]